MKQTKLEAVQSQELKGFRSLVDVYKRSGGVAEKVQQRGKTAKDSMLAVYRDRFTFTFILQNEVASIHFDRLRGEIFYKGHNIRNMELTEKHKSALFEVADIIANDQNAKSFYYDYQATLARILADK